MTKDLFEFEKCYYMNHFKVIPNLSGSSLTREARCAREAEAEPLPENKEVGAGQVQLEERSLLDRVHLRKAQGKPAQNPHHQEQHQLGANLQGALTREFHPNTAWTFGTSCSRTP